MRSFFGKTLAVAIGLLVFVALLPPLYAADITVTLLGTGTPQLNPRRMSYSTLVEAGGQMFMFDTGRAAMMQARKSQADLRNLKKLKTIFLTHFHSDHVVGFPDVWLTGFLAPFFRKEPLAVYGPPGVKEFTAGLRQAYAFDVRIRIAQYGGKRGAGMELKPTEVYDGFVFEKNGVRIKAFKVDHEDANPAFGYRIDYKGRSVVLSGDTIFNQNVIKNATGVDLLVHQIGYAPPEAIQKNKIVRRILAHHTKPNEVAKVFEAAKPKMAVFSHIVVFKLKGPDLSLAGEEALMREVRKYYKGEVVLGQDLMTFEIGDTVKIVK